MINITFPIDPANLSDLKRWLATQADSPGTLVPIDEMKEILIGHNVLLELPDVLLRAGVDHGGTVLLVMDETPMRRTDRDLKPFVQQLLREAGFKVTSLWLQGKQNGVMHADFVQVERVHAALTPGTALVALGSGTVTDIAKHAAYLYDQQHPKELRMIYICCQTANSVTAYAANMAVLLKGGVKRTIPSRHPTAIISDLQILACAPRAMTLAGLGDCCARFVAYGDWYLAGILGMVNFYSEVPLALLGNLDTILLEHAEGIGQRSHGGEAIIAHTLLLAGIAQSIVNMSAPISGMEHVISHVLDMTAEHNHRGLAMHGSQVGIAAITAAQLYRRFMKYFDPAAVNIEACYPGERELQAHIRRVFQKVDPSNAMAEECWNDYRKKITLWHQNRPRFENFCAHWQTKYRSKLASLVYDPATVQRILSLAGAPLTCLELEPPVSQEEYSFAVKNGHFIRSRFVLGDLLYFLGWKISKIEGKKW